MSMRGTIRLKEDGEIINYYPRTIYDMVINNAGGTLDTDINELKTFKNSVNDKLEGIQKDATKTEKSTINGNIKINGIETTVYIHPDDTGTRHVTDSEKEMWNSKETPEGAQTKADGALANAKGYTDTKVAGLMNAAPEALDTLKELADALGNDPNFSTTVMTEIGKKVDKVTGKGLSTNDYTTTEKEKLAGIATGANNYVHPATSGNKHIPAGGSAGQILRWSADGTAVWGADNNTTYDIATTTTNGLMSAADKTKLNGIATGANKYIHPTSAGNKHIPTGGASGQYLEWSASGTAQWSTLPPIPSNLLNGSAAGSLVSSDINPDTPIAERAIAFGMYCSATAEGAVAIGTGAVASGTYSTALGEGQASGSCAIAENSSTASGDYSHAEGIGCDSSGYSSHAEGFVTKAIGNRSHSEGQNTEARAGNAHAEGKATIASGEQAHAEGDSTTASGTNSHAEGESTTASGVNAHAEGKGTQAQFDCSHAEGLDTIAGAMYAHAEGNTTRATGINSHAEGYNTEASGVNSHTEGYGTKAIGSYAHAEGYKSIAEGPSAHAEGNSTQATGRYAHSEGSNTSASGDYSHAQGELTKALGQYAHAEGQYSESTGKCTHAEGYETFATSAYAHAEGCRCRASGQASHAEGYGSIASGTYAHSTGARSEARSTATYAGGFESIASGVYSYTHGYKTTAETTLVNVIGRYNKVNTGNANSFITSQNAFVIGNGSSASSLSNAFRITFDGKTYGLSAFNATGADYAEYFEWLDGNPHNEDRIGRFVALDGDKIKLAESPYDYIIGIISGNQSMIGNASEDSWNNMYLRDEFGRLIYEDVEVVIEDHEELEGTEELIPKAKRVTERRIKLNPDYNPNKTYIPRSERREWGIVGMLGQIVVKDNGTCKVNGFCEPTIDGIATHTDDKSGYRVISRINKNLIKVIMK